MKTLILSLILLLTIGACYKTSSGLVWVNGHRINFWKIGNQYIETNCTARTPFWANWRASKVCVGSYIWLRVGGKTTYCKVRKVRI